MPFVILYFFRCGHCKSLVPEYDKAASLLKGVVKVVAVDATEAQSLASKYQIQGFPTLKVFGADKNSPVEYQGQRTADSIVSEAMKAANQLVKERKSGKSKPSSGSNSNSRSSHNEKEPSGKSPVIELTEDNFKSMVLESDDHWIVEFFAPWCGHCKALAPEYEAAARQVDGSVKFGAVDATVHSQLAQQYGVRGYPTLKIFTAGKANKKHPQDYQGGRTASELVDTVLRTLDAAGVPPSLPQLTSPADFQQKCSQSGKFCVVAFLPHLLDSKASGRQQYLENFMEVAKAMRKQPIQWFWSEAQAQSGLESAMEVNDAYPTLSCLSLEKKVFTTMRLSWSVKNMKSFIEGVMSGRERIRSLASAPNVRKVDAWNGEDAVEEVEEMSLDEIMSD